MLRKAYQSWLINCAELSNYKNKAGYPIRRTHTISGYTSLNCVLENQVSSTTTSGATGIPLNRTVATEDV